MSAHGSARSTIMHDVNFAGAHQANNVMPRARRHTHVHVVHANPTTISRSKCLRSESLPPVSMVVGRTCCCCCFINGGGFVLRCWRMIRDAGRRTRLLRDIINDTRTRRRCYRGKRYRYVVRGRVFAVLGHVSYQSQLTLLLVGERDTRTVCAHTASPTCLYELACTRTS